MPISWTDLLTPSQQPGMGGGNSAIAQLLLQQSMDGSPIQSPVQGLAKLAQAWVAKGLMQQDQQQQQAGNSALASAIAPQTFQDAGGSAGQMTNPAGQSIDYTPPNIQDTNTDKRATLASLLNTGAIGSKELAPQLLQSLGVGAPEKPMALGADQRLVDLKGNILLGASDQYDTTPHFDQAGNAYVLDKQGNPKYLAGVKDRPKVEVSNGQAYDPYNTAPGTKFAPQPEAPMSQGRFNQEEALKDGKFSNPTLIEVDDGKGGTTQVTAQQDAKTGQWVTADEKRQPINAANVRIVSSANSFGGQRSQVQMLRMLSAGHTLTNELENVAALPSTSTAGIFGGAEQDKGLTGAVKADLTRAVNPQDVQSYQVASVGLTRALSQMEAAGLAPPGSLTSQMNGLILQKGDTELTRLQKLATMRQTGEGIMDAVLNSPMVSKTQKDEIAGLKSRIDKAIPFLPIDVINLAKAQDPKATIGQLAAQRGLGSAPKSKAPDGVDQSTWDHMTPQEQALWPK